MLENSIEIATNDLLRNENNEVKIEAYPALLNCPFILFFAFIAWSAYWFLGTIYIENKVLENNNLKYKKSSISGYPVFFDINLKN